LIEQNQQNSRTFNNKWWYNKTILVL